MSDRELQFKTVRQQAWNGFIAVFVLLLICFLAVQTKAEGISAATDGTGSQADPLAHLRQGHPRLLFTDEQLAAALAAAKTDPLRAELKKRIIATAEFIITAPPVRQPDNDLGQEQDRYAVYYVLHCAMAYRLTGDERFLTRAKNDLLTIAAFSDWNPEHFLSVGEMSFAVAIGYDWLYAKLKPEERAIIKKALLEKSLSFAGTTYGFTGGKAAWSGKNTGNWNQVCNGGLVSAALAIADEEPEPARQVIEGARKSLPRGMDAYAPDGGFPEGPGYWSYATTYAAITIAELESALGTDLGLSSSPGFDRTVNYYEAVEGPFGPVFNYADATDDLQISPARTWLAKRFHQSFALRHMRSLLSEFIEQNSTVKFDRGIQGTVINRFLPLHVVWFPAEITERVAGLPLDFHFHGDADIATFRSAWNDTNAIFVGFKAGENADHHNHLDLGSFVLDADGERWAMDLGPDNNGGSYTLPGYSGYRNGRRWVYLRTNNHGHNTVTPGDALQNRHVVAPITEFASTPGRSFAIADLKSAYSNEVTNLRRGIALLDRSRVLVQDEYQPTESNLPLHWQMVTKAEIALSADGRSATLTHNGRTLRVDLLQPAAAKFHVGSTKTAIPEENQNEGTRLLVGDLIPNTAKGVTRLVVLLTPTGSRWPKLNAPKVEPLAEWR